MTWKGDVNVMYCNPPAGNDKLKDESSQNLDAFSLTSVAVEDNSQHFESHSHCDNNYQHHFLSVKDIYNNNNRYAFQSCSHCDNSYQHHFRSVKDIYITITIGMLFSLVVIR